MTLAGNAPTNPLLDTPQYLKGVGPARYELLKKLGIHTIGDLLHYYPRTYEDLSDVRRIAELTGGGAIQTAAGEVVELEGRETRGGRVVLSVVIRDGSGVLEGVWFNQAFMARRFRHGQQVAFSGKPEWRFGRWQMNKPRVRFLGEEGVDPDAGGRVLAVYPLTEGLQAEQVRRIMKTVVEKYADLPEDIIPAELAARRRLVPLAQALRGIHRPATLPEAMAARKRLVYEEFLLLETALAMRRREHRAESKAPRLPVTRLIDERIRRLYPFPLTGDQNRVIAEICQDMAGERPMQRLLQADVGAGKTAVAVYALLLAVAHKHQAAIMAPTEILARQHWRTLSAYLERSRVRKLLLTGGRTSRERKAALGEIRMGQVDLVVGTQALIQEDVEFARLGLVVIDEQHRFGVRQRLQFREMGQDPHYLIMTATPIPRTVALTAFGDLDVSIIREMPPGRLPVVTRVVAEKQRARLEEHLRKAMRAGRQLYVICPLVEESAAGDIKAAQKTYAQLQEGPFRDFSLGLLHGRMEEREKDQVMTRFRRGELHGLVSTSVVEVGVDVPNATLMVIEHADRFGLSQLHQLRGRVSRGTVAGECYLFTQGAEEETRSRLRLFVSTTDGFKLAEMDLELRGMGQFFGTRQHGLGEIRIGNLISDRDLLVEARKDAFALVAADPGLSQPGHKALCRAVFAKYGATMELTEAG